MRKTFLICAGVLAAGCVEPSSPGPPATLSLTAAQILGFLPSPAGADP